MSLAMEAELVGLATRQRVGDFGGLVKGWQNGMFRPRTVEELVEVVQRARNDGIRLTPRGGGLSQSGQSVPDDSWSLSLTELTHVAPPDAAVGTVRCQSGATFRSVLSRCLEHGCIPRVLPLNLDLTVGGVLSAGGFGTTSHRFGPVVSNVASAEVVLGTGELVETGPARAREVYDAVLGGLGRSGVVASAELCVEPAPSAIRTVYLVYDELESLFADVETLRSQALHLEAFCSSSFQGLCRANRGARRPLVHWLYGLHVSVDSNTDPRELVAGLGFNRVLHTDEDECGPFAARYDLRFERMRSTGAWGKPHPWFEAILPRTEAQAFIERAMKLLPLSFGDGHRISVLASTDHPKALALPRGPALGFAVLPQCIEQAALDEALSALRRLDCMLSEVGGKRYLSGYLFDMDSAAWQRHYGDAYSTLLSLKHRFDPTNVFGSALAPL